ncbi:MULTISPECIES: heme o synthase [unclassified Thalassotalea]|uniref:heme o synthase n=1 Tax=unclassified Thalassotalea TaxID=2614972 RepID=UPI0010819371|nr:MULTISPECIES: heme o synthase [unclassified Thalassotalea]NMP16089.1 protoheme IX farnesyltransferase [Thalassotalea sp. Y01]QBY04095.1 protoheme IX farnesyltransferase [Thalassotalea sp. HSM 43]
MAKSSAPSIALEQDSPVSWREYYEITKPRVVALLVLTALVGMSLSVPGAIPWQILIPAMLGIGLLSSASAAINHIVDQRIDAVMARTHNRPLPNGRISNSKAIAFAASLALIGFVMLYGLVNPLTAWLTLSGLVGYSVVYTMYLKRATPQNITIGGLAGAIPPLLGWTAMTNEIHPHALLLVLLVFTWTPPHFWALAIHRRDDYAKVNIPMLPVTHGIEFTKTQILLYTILLFVVGLIPYLVGMSGWIYLIGACALNIIFFAYSWKLKFNADKQTAMQTFRFSIVHLMLLFIVLLVDHYALPAV